MKDIIKTSLSISNKRVYVPKNIKPISISNNKINCVIRTSLSISNKEVYVPKDIKK